MRRKIKTTPFQREILWAMADEGRIGFLALLETLATKFPAESPSSLLQRVEREIGVLERVVGLYFFWQFGADEEPVLWTDRTTMRFEDHVRWNETTNRWEMQPREPPVTDLIVQLTQGGVEALNLIADESSEPVPVFKSKETS